MSDKYKPGFRVKKIKRDLLGKNPEDWRSYITLAAPLLADSMEIISLGDKYIVSVGYHIDYLDFLMDKNGPQVLTVESSLNASALISFLTDSPIVPVHNRENNFGASNVKYFNQSFRGSTINNAEAYFEILGQVVEVCCKFVERCKEKEFAGRRQFFRQQYSYDTYSEWIYADWPSKSDVWRAITAYWSGLLSPTIPSRLLNFWRALEAVKPTKKAKIDTLKYLDKAQVSPVWSQVMRPNKPNGTINSIGRLKLIALQHKKNLIKKLGTEENILDLLWSEKRGKAAHADTYAIEYEGVSALGEQLLDSELLQYMARAAIEEAWG